ncbi:MAG: hypothetical protein ACLVBP_02585 [Ruminococcus sp.]
MEKGKAFNELWEKEVKKVPEAIKEGSRAGAMTTQITHLAAEFILELSQGNPEDYLQLKLMMLSAVRHPQVETFLQKVFSWRMRKTAAA